MAVTTIADLVQPQILADAVQGYVGAGKSALIQSGAALIKFGMPTKKAGETVTIPYFGSIGDMDDVAADGDAATVTKISQTSETATVVHSRKVVEITEKAGDYATDPVGEIRRQMGDAINRRIDKALLAAADSATGWSSYTSTVAATISYDAVVNARLLLGDESEDWAAMVVHSKQFADMLKLKDTTGQPLLLPNAYGNDGPSFLGMRLLVSDRVTVTAGTPNTYNALLLKRGSLVAWVHDLSDKDIRTDVDISIPADLMAMHIYFAAHRYSRIGGATKPGVIRLVTQ